jgi:hypothetical protein
MSGPPIFTVTFATDGTDGIRALRALLKAAKRRFGLRAVEVREYDAARVSRRRTARAARRTQARRQEKSITDMRKYSGAAFLKPGDIKASGPRRVVITDVTEGKFDKPDLEFDDYTKLSVNANNRILMAAYGWESKGWLNKEIELGLGQAEYDGKEQEIVLVKPISPPIEKTPPPKPKGGSDNESKSGRSNRLSRPRLVNS